MTRSLIFLLFLKPVTHFQWEGPNITVTRPKRVTVSGAAILPQLKKTQNGELGINEFSVMYIFDKYLSNHAR